jgi:Neurotransmitter-gated ion-channel transmembrane region
VAEFHMQRAIGYHLVQSYLPSILVVVISWVSFWLDVEAIPARVTLGVTTLLTISSKASGIQAGLPQVYIRIVNFHLPRKITRTYTTSALNFSRAFCLREKKNTSLKVATKDA